MDLSEGHPLTDPTPSGWDGLDRRPSDKTELILHRLSSMERGMQDVNASLNKLAEHMARLALVEERIGQVNDALGRAFKELDAAKARVATLEQAAPLTKTATEWVFKAVLAGVSLVAVYVAAKTGLKP